MLEALLDCQLNEFAGVDYRTPADADDDIGSALPDLIKQLQRIFTRRVRPNSLVETGQFNRQGLSQSTEVTGLFSQSREATKTAAGNSGRAKAAAGLRCRFVKNDLLKRAVCKFHGLG